MDKNIGQKLRILRGSKSVKEVAQELGISASAIRMYEAGFRIPTDANKIKIAKYFNSTVDSIFFAAEFTECKLDEEVE